MSDILVPKEDLFQRFHYDNLTKGFVVETFQDVAPYLNANKRMYNDNQVNRNSSSRLKSHLMGEHKASIPMVILHKWMKEFQTYTGAAQPPKMHDEDFKKYISKKLKDPENRFLRVDGRKD